MTDCENIVNIAAQLDARHVRAKRSGHAEDETKSRPRHRPSNGKAAHARPHIGANDDPRHAASRPHALHELRHGHAAHRSLASAWPRRPCCEAAARSHEDLLAKARSEERGPEKTHRRNPITMASLEGLSRVNNKKLNKQFVTSALNALHRHDIAPAGAAATSIPSHLLRLIE